MQSKQISLKQNWNISEKERHCEFRLFPEGKVDFYLITSNYRKLCLGV